MLLTRRRKTRVGKRRRTSMSAEENKALARRFLEAQVNGDLDILEELLAPTSSIIASNLAKSLAARASCS